MNSLLFAISFRVKKKLAPYTSDFTFLWVEKRVMGPACSFNTHLGFYLILKRHPSIGEIMNLPKAALLCSTFTDFLHYNNLLLTKGFPTGAYAVRLPFL